MATDLSAMDAYARGGSKKVAGWLTPLDADVTRVLLHDQRRRGVAGGVAEIGVHHGRYFIELALSLDEGQRAIAIDVFEDQHLNVDASGRGDRAAFEANLAAFGIDASRVAILKASSMDVGPERIAEAVGPVRFFSVDGGHWADIVLNDLDLAAGSLAPDGIIALDDILHRDWPEVTLALGRWLAEPRPVVPFAMSAKLYLARPEAAAVYAQALRSNPRLSLYRAPSTASWMGAEVERFMPRRATFDPRRPVRTLKNLLAATAPGVAVRLRRAAGIG